MRFFQIALLTALLFFTASGALPQKQINNKPFCNLYELLKSNRFTVSLAAGSTNAGKKGISCRFAPKQRRTTVNNVKIELLNAPSYQGNVPWLSTMDWYKTLRPVFYPATIPRRPINLIMIDMGHGGKDPGASGAFSKEKMINLRIGRRVAEILRAYGFRVKMTRNSDIQIPLKRVCSMQRQSKSDLFVSIHVNSAADRKVSGIETFCLTPAGAASSNGGNAVKTIYKGNSNDAANIFLAYNIQKSLLLRTGAVDRGVKRARFAVLKDIDAPGVLVEVGFISNRAEERKLNDRKYIDRIARGIVDGIVNYSRATKVRK